MRTAKRQIETFKMRKRKRQKISALWMELINMLHERNLYRKLLPEDRDFIMSCAYPGLPFMPKIPLLPYDDTVFEDTTKENSKK